VITCGAWPLSACYSQRFGCLQNRFQDTYWHTQNENFDQNKCVRMALVHDIGEAIIGDITPSDGVSEGTS